MSEAWSLRSRSCGARVQFLRIDGCGKSCSDVRPSGYFCHGCFSTTKRRQKGVSHRDNRPVPANTLRPRFRPLVCFVVWKTLGEVLRGYRSRLCPECECAAHPIPPFVRGACTLFGFGSARLGTTRGRSSALRARHPVRSDDKLGADAIVIEDVQ